jgi:hypothetical protein
MREFNPWQRCAAGRLWFLLLMFSFFTLVSAGTARTQSIPRCTSAEQCLSLGVYYYNNDDITDKAVRQFNLVMTKYAGSKQAEQAQYFLASYYQRKYYIQLRRQGRDDRKLLELAANEYRKYTDRYYKTGSGQWLADAFFNLGLVYLQVNDSNRAGNELSKMRDASGRDGSVYVYQIIWSSSPDDIVDSYVAAKPLADFALSILYGRSSIQQRSGGGGNSFDQKVLMLRKWCQLQKSRQAQAHD